MSLAEDARLRISLVTSVFLLGVAAAVGVRCLDVVGLSSARITSETVASAERFFLLFWHAPSAVKSLLHGLAMLDIVCLAMSFSTWNEAALYFDGASLLLVAGIVLLYLTVLVPCLFHLSPPDPDPTSRPLFQVIGQLGGNPGIQKLELNDKQRREVVQVVAASSVLIFGLLLAITLLQCGKWYSQKQTSHRKTASS